MSDEPHEIVIIKRGGGGHEDEHHGGVWKIAFADFMTAMMAFFLVMWLISANDKTKAVIARYFNPVQLVDSTPQPKGLEDPKPGSPSVMPKSAAAAPEPKDKASKPDAKPAESKPAESKPAESKPESPEAKAEAAAAAATAQAAKQEAALFVDPYAVLSEIASKDQPKKASERAQALKDGQKGGSGAVGLKGGEAYRDPFEPTPMPAGTAAMDQPNAADIARPEIPGTAAPSTPPRPEPSGATTAPATPAPAPQPTPDVTAGTLASRIEAAVKATAPTPVGAPTLDIHHTSEGTVIDLTDGAGFAMFGSASAEPSPKMVRLMEKIGRLLKTEKGRITIRGYTDSRPFRSDTYDNWRLSSARAHMAHYMLVRGGLDEQRIEAIEGYADRHPKNPKDPDAPENRRIEILIRDTAP